MQAQACDCYLLCFPKWKAVLGKPGKIEKETGKEHLVLDLSCRKKNGAYYIVTDRWQKFTDVKITLDTLRELGAHCDEFLIHGVDVEGKAGGIEAELVKAACRVWRTVSNLCGRCGKYGGHSYS